MNTEEVAQLAEDKFLAGYNCAQAVLYANCERLRFDKDAALRLATGFGAGAARQGELCGAVSGAVIALGLRYGRGEGEGRSRTDDTYERTQTLLRRFSEAHGSVRCRELIGCDLRTPEGQAYFRQNDLLHRTCLLCVRTAAKLTAEAIQ